MSRRSCISSFMVALLGWEYLERCRLASEERGIYGWDHETVAIMLFKAFR